MEALKKRWINFIEAIADPCVVLLLIAAVALTFFTKGYIPEPSTIPITLCIVLISIIMGLVSGRVVKLWMDREQESVLRARGTISVRSLMLLLRSLSSLESRVKSFHSNLDNSLIEKTESGNEQIIKRNYEEILSKANELQEETLSSIENWTDILPEADIKTQIGLITELKNEKDEKEAELQRIQSEYAKDKTGSEDEKRKYKQEIQKREKEISNLKAELYKQKSNLDVFFPEVGHKTSLPILPRPGLFGLGDSTPPVNEGSFSSGLDSLADFLEGTKEKLKK